MPNNIKVLLVGAGPMAIDYAHVLNDQNILFEVVGRGLDSSNKFKSLTGSNAYIGGLENFISTHDLNNYTHAIIATGVENLAYNAKLLSNNGIKSILVEKPAGLNLEEISELNSVAELNGSKIFVAYNRRFYSSVLKAKKLIEEDGGVTSFHFDFTEWSHKIDPLIKATGVKENWLLANSTHVIDLAFFLGGKPENLNCYSSGKGNLSWHPYSVYTGAGVSENGSLFSYHANWESAGRWGIELSTKNRKLILRPLEKLYSIDKGTVNILDVNIDDHLDLQFKPGLYKQVEAFLSTELNMSLVTIAQQTNNVEKIFNAIARQN